jgi:hypothetical protein
LGKDGCWEADPAAVLLDGCPAEVDTMLDTGIKELTMLGVSSNWEVVESAEEEPLETMSPEFNEEDAPLAAELDIDEEIKLMLAITSDELTEDDIPPATELEIDEAVRLVLVTITAGPAEDDTLLTSEPEARLEPPEATPVELDDDEAACKLGRDRSKFEVEACSVELKDEGSERIPACELDAEEAGIFELLEFGPCELKNEAETVEEAAGKLERDEDTTFEVL